MNKLILLFTVIGVLFIGIIPSAAADMRAVVPKQAIWTLVPVNPEYKAYMADLAAGRKVPAVMPQRVDYHALEALRNISPAIKPSKPFAVMPITFPSSYDLRALGRVTPSKISHCGSCWTSAAFGSLESYLAPGEIWDFSEDHMQLNSGLDYPTCNAGAYAGIATNYLAAWRGPVNETDFDYKSTAPQNPKVQKHVQRVFCLPERKNPLDNYWIKTALMYYGGVYSSGSRSYGYNPTYNTYYNPEVGSGHAVTIVGWDDNFDRNKFLYNYPNATQEQKVPPGNGAFIIKDNQGPDWADKGYYYVSYYDKAHGSGMTVFTAEPATNYNRIYQYDTLGTNESLVIPKTTGGSTYAANVFTAVADEDLSAVGFFNLLENYYPYGNVNYKIQVYLDPANGPLNIKATPSATVNITMPLPGYYTVKLPKRIPLKKGRKFSVVLSGLIVNGNWGASVPLERPFDGYSAAAAKPGEGYISPDGLSWQDVTTVKVYNSQTQAWEPLTNTSICIKAFTNHKLSISGTLSGQGLQNMAWLFSNNSETAVSVKPVARLYQNGRGFTAFGSEVAADYYLDKSGISHKARDGWIQAPPGETITIYPKPGALTGVGRVAYNYYSVDPVSRLVRIWDGWKFMKLDSPLHVVSTEPLNNEPVNYPLNLVRVIFDKEIKSGPGLNSISVMSTGAPSEAKMSFNSVSGNTLLIALTSPIYISRDPGAGKILWQAHIPADAVTDMDGNSLNQDYIWSFTTGLAY